MGSHESSSASAASSTASDAASSVTGYTTFSQPSSSGCENKRSPSASVDGAGGYSTNRSASASAHTPAYRPPIEDYRPSSAALLGNMNQTQPYMDMPSSHLTSTQPYSSQAGSTDHLPHYSHYSQPPILHHPGPPTYSHGTTPYSAYGYPNSVSSPQSASHPPANMLSLPPRKLGPTFLHHHTHISYA